MHATYRCSKWCCACVGAPSQDLKFRLEVFKTANRGWGVRSWDFIPAGTYITSFIGKIYRHADADALKLDPTYHYDMLPRPAEGQEHDNDPKYIVDAKHFGNVSRFINHSCDPNVYIQPTLAGHLDPDHPTIALFALKNIPPWSEIAYDYDHIYVSNLPNGCLCGATTCTRPGPLHSEMSE